MSAGLLDWLDEPDARAGIAFAGDEDGDWERVSYAALAGLAGGVAAALAEHGIERDDVVTLVHDTGPGFVAAFFGTLLAGATPSPLAPPTAFQRPDEYVERAAGLLAAARPALVLCEPAYLAAMTAAGERARLARAPVALETVAPADAAGLRRPPAELALLQFTSGSSGAPRGVRVPRAALEANVAAIRGWLAMGRHDVTATWLPLHHDMGLIGCMLTPVVNRSPVLVLRPEQFIRAPARWIDCFGRLGASLTASPSFGFAYCASRLRDRDPTEWDLSGWRVAIVGAERVDARTLDAFATLMEPAGFDRSTFRPAYGLAEATLAVAAHPGERPPTLARVDWSGIAVGEPAAVDELAELGAQDVGAGVDWVVGCGGPVAGARVTIVDEDGDPVPEGTVGEIAVGGASVAAGYQQAEAGAARTRFDGDRLLTGDCGFVANGELFVVGRAGDSLKVRGRSLFAEDLEARLCAVPGVRPGRVVALLGAHGGRDVAAAVVEGAPDEALAAIEVVLRREAGPAARIVCVSASPGAIERTTSGKPRRRVLWARLVAGELDGRVAFDSGGAQAVAGAA